MPRKGNENSRMRGHASRDSMFGLLVQRRLTSPVQNVTINTIRGDSESVVEIQPHLNSGLWPVYMEQCEMQFVPPPTDGSEEAPGAHPQKPKQ